MFTAGSDQKWDFITHQLFSVAEAAQIEELSIKQGIFVCVLVGISSAYVRKSSHVNVFYCWGPKDVQWRSLSNSDMRYIQ